MIKFKLFLVAVVMGLVLVSPALAAGGWSVPTVAPPQSNAEAPINVSTTDQIKQGGLSVNSLLWSLHKFFVGQGSMEANFLTDPSYVAQFNGTVKVCNPDGTGCQSVTGGGSGGSFWADRGSNNISNTNTGDVGVGTKLQVGDSPFGAQVSGSSGGHGLFGSNLYVDQTDHFKTVGNHASYGYSGVEATWGGLNFYTASGATSANAPISPTPAVAITNAGNVGIGTSAPASKLDIAGSLKAETVSSVGDGIFGYIAGNRGGIFLAPPVAYGKPAVQSVTSGWGGDNLLLNPAGGKVGIGTTNPSQLLEVAGGIKAGSLDATAVNATFVTANNNVTTNNLCLGGVCKATWPTTPGLINSGSFSYTKNGLCQGSVSGGGNTCTMTNLYPASYEFCALTSTSGGGNPDWGCRLSNGSGGWTLALVNNATDGSITVCGVMCLNW